jgi:hypothetical protein
VENLAKFTINGSPSEDGFGNRGYFTFVGDTLEIELEQNPSPDVLSVTYDLYNPFDPSSPIGSLSVLDWPAILVWDENLLPKITPADKQDAVHIDLTGMVGNEPAGPATWIIRATAVTSEGTHVFERAFCVANPVNTFAGNPGYRERVPGERTEFYGIGWELTDSHRIRNSFPVLAARKKGSTNAVATTDGAKIGPPLLVGKILAEAVILVDDVAASASSLWMIYREFYYVGFVLTASPNSIISQQSSGGTQVLSANWVPTLDVSSGFVAIRHQQIQAAHTFDWVNWLALTYF